MDFSAKPRVRRLRVLQRPHRLNVSGVVPAGEDLPIEDVSSTYLVGVTELVGDVIEVPLELVTRAEQAKQK